MFCIFYYTILFNYNFRYSHFFKQNSFKVATAPILDYFLLIKKNSLFPLIYQGLRVYLPQHCLYFLPDPHGTHKSAFFNTLIFLKAFICGLFCVFSFLILPLKSSVYGSKSGSKMSFFPHLLSFITSSLYHFFLIISS